MPENTDKTVRLINAAQSYIGTPFVPQGRLPQVGLDCAGVIICAARDAGYTVTDTLSYSIPPAPEALPNALAQLTPTSNISAGCVLLLRFMNRAQHLALATSATHMVHAYAPAGCVVHTHISDAWQQRLLGVYHFI